MRPLTRALGFVLIATALRAQDPANLAVGRPYTLTPAPDYALCTDAEDTRQLTDGVTVPPGKQIWVDQRCVGWRRREPVEVVIDLGRSQAVAGLVVHSGAAPLADVYLPDVLVAVSDDGADFRVVSRLATADLPQTLRQVLRLDGLRTRGRYVLVRLTAPFGQYVFVDELEVRAGTHDPAAVTWPAERLAPVTVDERSELQKRLTRALDRLEQRLPEPGDLAGPLAAARQAIAALPTRRQGKLSGHEPSAAAALARQVAELQAAAARRTHPSPRLAVTAVSPWAELLPGDLPGPTEPELTELRVVLAGREYESRAVLLSNLSAAPVTVNVSLSPPDWPGRLQLRHVPFIGNPDGFPLADALPLLDRPLVVPPWECRMAWLTIHSGDSAPGAYEAAISLTGAQTRRLPLRIEVLPVRLPDELPLASYSWQYVDSIATLQGIEQEAVADLAAHYQNVAILSANHFPRPSDQQVDAAGNLTTALDFSALDRWIKLVEPISRRGLTWFPSLRFDGRLGTPAFTTFAQWVKQLVAHLKGLGLDEEDFFVYPVDESIQEDLVGSGQAIRAADPKLRIFADPMMRDRDDILKAAVPFVDIWCPALFADQPRQMGIIRQTGRTLWSYNVLPRSSSPYGGYRLSPWKAFERGATGCGFWCYAVGDQWRNRDMWREPSSLYAVIYTLEGAPPDISRAEKIIPSRRWEAWREGVEDYTWLWLLRQRGQDDPTARRTVDEAVRAVLAEPDDLALADAHRERLLRRLAERG